MKKEEKFFSSSNGMNYKNLIYLVLILFVVGLAAGVFIYLDLSKKPSEVVPQEQEEEDLVVDANIIKERMPDLDKEIIITEEMDEGRKIKLLDDIETARSFLKNDYDDLANWLQLGLLLKAAGDYEGAIEAWKFATLIRPKDSVSFHNIGDVCWMHLQDYVCAEENFLKSIENSPHVYTYQKLHELYRYSYTEKSDLADDVLFDGLETNPNDIFLTAVLARYYEETGDIVNAIIYYEKALELDPGNAYLIQALGRLNK